MTAAERTVPYNNLSGWLRENGFGRLKKLCIDGGFTCPNRDGTCGTGGCIFCGERGSGEHIPHAAESIAAQTAAFLAHAPRADGYIAYFQNFTNTYAPVEILRERYDAALTDPRIRVLDIGTRPDCIDGDIAGLLADYARERTVWVELGLQTASDRTAEIINRGYPTETFLRAAEILHSRGLPVIAHIMLGLPGEGRADFRNTAKLIAKAGVFGVKIHCVYVMRGTVLAQMYQRGDYTPMTMAEYAESAAEVLTLLPPEIVIHRLTGDAPPDLLIAPDWNRRKNEVLAMITGTLRKNNQQQGKMRPCGLSES